MKVINLYKKGISLTIEVQGQVINPTSQNQLIAIHLPYKIQLIQAINNKDPF